MALPSERSFHHPAAGEDPEAWWGQVRGTSRSDQVEGRWEPRPSGSAVVAARSVRSTPASARSSPGLSPSRCRRHPTRHAAGAETGGVHPRARPAPRCRRADGAGVPSLASPHPRHAGRPHRWSSPIDGRCCRRWAADPTPSARAALHAQPFTQRGVQALPRPIQSPFSLVVLHRLPRRPVLRQEAPGPARAQLREEGVEDGAERMETGTTDLSP
jgi:hypothetical protein